jgi:N-acetylglucosamine malate deacetylase 1
MQTRIRLLRRLALPLCLLPFLQALVSAQEKAEPLPPRARRGLAEERPAPGLIGLLIEERKLQIIAFGAHPDDCELKAGGVAAKWAALGHKVKFVSVTNGDIGHHQIAGGPLARRRTAEVEECARILGIRTQVLDHHDGELEPSLENRREITRLIRDWNADIVLTPRPNDYHPDHRYTAILVQDAAFMVTVPFFCPDTPALRKNPVFLYYSDGFKKPAPFRPDVVVGIDDVVEKKFDCIAALRSQFYEWTPWLEGYADEVPQGDTQRRAWVAERFGRWYKPIADSNRELLLQRYGPEKGKSVRFAEAFEVCEYGSQPSQDELKKLFPF